MVDTGHTSGSSDTQLEMDNNQYAAQTARDEEKQSEEPEYTQSPGVLARLEHFTWVSLLLPQVQFFTPKHNITPGRSLRDVHIDNDTDS